jgi:hypothetical protein
LLIFFPCRNYLPVRSAQYWYVRFDPFVGNIPALITLTWAMHLIPVIYFPNF